MGGGQDIFHTTYTTAMTLLIVRVESHARAGRPGEATEYSGYLREMGPSVRHLYIIVMGRMAIK